MRISVTRPVVLTALVAQLMSPPHAASAQEVAPTREEIERGRIDERPPQPRLSVRDEIERAPCPLAEERFKDIRVELRDVVFDNLRQVTKEDLRPAFASFVGQTIPLAAICDIRDRAATILRRQGYIAAVQVPPQRIEDGIVRFDVVMARIIQVRVRGDAGRSERQVAAYLEKLRAQELFNERDAERYLLLARDLPGIDVRLVLRPAGTAPGEVVADVSIVRQPVEIDANVQNYGSHSVGRWGGLLRAQFHGLTGLADRTTLAVFSTSDFEEQKVLQLGHDMRLGGEGLILGGRFTYAWTKPGGEAASAGIEARTLLAAIEAGFPVVRAQAGNVRVNAGLDFINQKVLVPGQRLNDDRLRVLYGRVDLDTIDRASIEQAPGYSVVEPRWRLGASVELRRGLAILDGIGRAPPIEQFGDRTATVLRFQGLGEVRPSPAITLAAIARAQYAANPLPNFEEYSAGNYTIGRGYDPGALTGDSGVGTAVEMRLGSAFPRGPRDLAFQPFLFLDAAWVWNEDPDAAPRREKLVSVGGGVRAVWGDAARVDLAFAVPTRRIGADNVRPDPRLLLSITTRLLPWTR